MAGSVNQALAQRRRALQVRDRDPAAAAAALRLALTSLDLARQPVEYALVNHDLADILLRAGADDRAAATEAAAAATRALAVLSPQAFPDLFAGASERLGLAQWRMGERQAARRTYAEAAEALAQAGHPNPRAHLLATVARLMAQAAGATDAAALDAAGHAFDRAIEATRSAGRRPLLAELLNDAARLRTTLAGASGSPNVEQALPLFDEAATLVDDADLDRALAIHANRAAAYAQRAAGERDANLRQAISSYERATRLPGLEARPRAAARLYRALGNAWSSRSRGERSRNVAYAEAAWHTALERLSPDADGAERAAIWNERGLLQVAQAHRGFPEAADAAIAAFRRGGAEVEGSDEQALTAQLANNRGSAIMTAASLGGTASLAEAAAALDLAADTWQALGRLEDAGGTLLNGGLVYLSLHTADGKAGHLDRAVDRLRASAAARPRPTHPQHNALAQFNLGLALAIRAQHERPDDLAASAAAFQIALDIWDAPGAPPQAAVAHTNLAGVLFDLAGDDDADGLEQAVRHYEQALAVYRRDTHPTQHAAVARGLMLTRRRLASTSSSSSDG